MANNPRDYIEIVRDDEYREKVDSTADDATMHMWGRANDDNEDIVKLKSDVLSHESEMRRTMRANGIYEPDDLKYWTTFYRLPRIDPFNHVQGAREYVFFTKPDLPILRYNDGSPDDKSKSGWLSN